LGRIITGGAGAGRLGDFLTETGGAGALRFGDGFGRGFGTCSSTGDEARTGPASFDATVLVMVVMPTGWSTLAAPAMAPAIEPSEVSLCRISDRQE